jgi:hypothetical protein
MRRLISSAACLAIASTLSFAVVASAQETDMDPPHPAHIHAGVCPEPGDVVAPLEDLSVSTEDPQGLASAIPVEVSVTSVDLALEDILAGEHSINVHQSAEEMDLYIACGDIGGSLFGGTALAIGLAEQNDSGHSGVAWLLANEDGTTTVSVYLVAQPPADEGVGATESPAAGESPAAESPAAGESPAASGSPSAVASPGAEMSEMPMMSPDAGSSPMSDEEPLPEGSPTSETE